MVAKSKKKSEDPKNINAGDLVRLRGPPSSCGPTMTVEAVEFKLTGPVANTVWYDTTRNLFLRDSLPTSAVIKVQRAA